ncbi:MAG TPA: hypothetical protein VMP01_12545 [Pirellulaceae bacterium]|nr:hypothetical protein [Pirellulaceae bacterium]
MTPLTLRDVLAGAQLRIFAEGNGGVAQLLHVWNPLEAEQLALSAPTEETPVGPSQSVFFDNLLVVTPGAFERSTDKNPPRLFSTPGKHNLYAAIVTNGANDASLPTLRSKSVAITVRRPREAELAFEQFFAKDRQFPPFYGGPGADQGAILDLSSLIVNHPMVPIADDAREYVMRESISLARMPVGSARAYDMELLVAAARSYLDISPERKLLRRRSVRMWISLANQFRLDEASPILRILSSWKDSSPFDKEELQSQAALDRAIARIEARLIEEARQRAAAPPPKPKPLPTD